MGHPADSRVNAEALPDVRVQREGDFSLFDSLPLLPCCSLRDDDLPPPDCMLPPPLVPLVPDDPPASSPLRWQAASDASNTGMTSNAVQRS